MQISNCKVQIEVVGARRRLPGVLAWARTGRRLWCSAGYQIVTYDLYTGCLTPAVRLPSRTRLLELELLAPARRFLRRGVRSYLQLDESSFIAFCDDNSYYWPGSGGSPQLLGRVHRGHGPLVQGCCLDASGACFYGDYWGNPEREDVRVWHWRPGETTWQEYFRFPAGSVRHIHAVQHDPFSGTVWVATGDRDQESIIGCLSPATSRRSQAKLTVIASGSQQTRAVSLVFTPEYVYWGSDGGRDSDVTSNCLYRWSRTRNRIECLSSVGGPVYYSTPDSNGGLYFATAVEGSRSESDRWARVWALGGPDHKPQAASRKPREIGRWEKDRFPTRLGYGTLWFPHGAAFDDKLCVAGQGLKGGPATWILEV